MYLGGRWCYWLWQMSNLPFGYILQGNLQNPSFTIVTAASNRQYVNKTSTTTKHKPEAAIPI